MAFNFGALVKGAGAAARSIDTSRKQEKQEAMLLEDRLAQGKMRDLQMRKLEDEINRPAPADSWEEIETPDGYIEVNKRTREIRPMVMGDQRVRGVPKAEPLEVVLGKSGERVYTPRSQAAGKTAPTPAEPLVQVATPEGGSVYKTRSEAVGAQAPQPASATGAADARKQSTALKNLLASLDSFEQTLTTIGSTVLPSQGKDVLQTSYNDALLKAKEAYNLGVLNGPDYMLMQRVLGDPTSLTNRAKAYGDPKEQTNRSLAQLRKMRSQFQSQLDGLAPAPGAGVPQDHSAMSDEEFAKAWAAGQFKKP